MVGTQRGGARAAYRAHRAHRICFLKRSLQLVAVRLSCQKHFQIISLSVNFPNVFFVIV
jgi:hypothetical protein